MALTITQGYQAVGGRILPQSTATWADLASSPYGSWTAWTAFNPEPQDIIMELAVDAGSLDYRVPILTLEYQGTLTISLDHGTEIDSAGDIISPTTINFAPLTPVAAPLARYYKFTITVGTDSNLTMPYASTPVIDFDSARVEEYLEAIDTSTLGGTIDARPLTPAIIGTVTFLAMTAQTQGQTYSNGLLQDRQYAIPDDYTFQDNAIITNAVTLDPPVIRCFDLNGESIDALVDVYLKGIPQMQQGLGGIEKTGE